MNKPMLTGMLAGIGVAVAGGVAGFSIMNKSAPDEGQLAEVAVTDTTQSDSLTDAQVTGQAVPEPAPVAAAPRQAAQPRREPVAAPAAAPVAAAPSPAPATPVAEECWDEEVVVEADPRDDKAIAGTAAGAVIGGALADRLGDDDDLVTAAGAAAGAFIGRRAQRKYQENRTTTVIERRCAPVQTQ
jgi:uncharacterized protein YcfJ